MTSRKRSLVWIGATLALAVPAASADSAGQHAITLQGSCEISGVVRFQPPLTNTPQTVTQRAEASGTCSGSLVDAQGREHQLADEPVTYSSYARVPGASCVAGTANGTGALGFQYGRLDFEFSETRPAGTPLLTYKGADSGSAVGTARPAPSQDPAAALEQCGGTGMREFQVEGDAATTPAMSG